MSGWKGFRLVPDDVLFFRDGKPSTRGADHYLLSLFPPHPSTLYGALRTRRLLDEGLDLSKLRQDTWTHQLQTLENELGPWGGFGSLALRGPWLVRGPEEPLLSAPHDLGIVIKKAEPAAKGNEEKPLEAAQVVRYRPVGLGEKVGGWSHPLALMRPFGADGREWTAGPGTEPHSAVGWFLTPAGLTAWRRGGVPSPEDLIHQRALWLDEARTGVGLETARRLAAEGLLYTFGFVRLCQGISLGFEASETELKAGGHLRLGGEGKTAAMEMGPPWPDTPAESPEGRFLALCFATPALSAAGAWPPGFAEGAAHGTIQGRRLRLVAAAVQGYETVGGWDVARQFPKPLRRALPAGSVFLFEPEDGATPSDFDGQRFSDFPQEHLARQGFGLTVAGVST